MKLDKLQNEKYENEVQSFCTFHIEIIRRSIMPNVEVSCTISNCLFHEKGNLCGAEKILVDRTENARSRNNTEFAADFDIRSATEKASTSGETCCQTFEPKKNHSH